MIPEAEDFFDLIDGTVLQNGLKIQNFVGTLEMNRRSQLRIKQWLTREGLKPYGF